MQKTGLKTFVYSFSVSLFAIFAANGIYLHTRPSARQDVKIPSKNVMLFLKDDAFNPSLKPAPVKKIALTVLPELKQEPEILPVQAKGAVYEPPADEIILANNFIPLETGSVFDSFDEAEPDVEPLEIVPPQPAAVKIAEISPQPDKNGAQTNISREKPKNLTPPPLSAKTVPAPKSTGKPKKAETPPAQKIEADKPVLIAANEPAQRLVPLEKSRDEKLNGRKIKIGEPDKLNQVALADKNIPISSMENQKAADTPPPPAWEQMSEKETDSPWVVAKGAGATRNELLRQESYYKKENEQIKAALDLPAAGDDKGSVQVASDTVKNLLIPIPEDILNDENLVPQLSYSSNEQEKAKDKEFDEKMAAKDASSQPAPTAKQPAESKPAKASQPENILTSLNTIFSSKTKVKEAKKEPEKKSGLLAELREKLSPAQKITIMPTEMRLSFQPNRAEISGQTLRWIQAFAARAAEDNLMSIEIRIDGTSGMELQQKRLNLLHNILTNKGVEYSKINTVFTSREPNSFIIRTVTRNFDRRGLNRNNNTQTAGRYLQW